MKIDRIEVKAPYCFGDDPLVFDDLGLVNFIFAPNGSGKTTISRQLAKQPEDVEERKRWPTAKTNLAIRVFNDKYKQSLMQEYISGIFTLGKESQEANKEIKRLQGMIKQEEENQEKWRAQIGDTESPAPDSLEGNIQKQRQSAVKSVFSLHKTIAPESVIPVVFEGCRSNKIKMFDEALRRYKKRGSISSGNKNLSWDILEKKVSSLLSAEKRNAIHLLTVSRILSAKSQAALEAELQEVGKGEFASLIERLENADWVNQGRAYVEKSDGTCPFCQQEALQLSQKLTEYFENGYDQSVAEIGKIRDAVQAKIEQLQEELDQLKKEVKNDQEIAYEPLGTLIREIRIGADGLMRKIDDKKLHPTKITNVSESVSYIQDAINRINQLVIDENSKIEEHNQLVDDTAEARRQVKEDGWSLFLDDTNVNDILSNYHDAKNATAWKKEKLLQAIKVSKNTKEGLESDLKKWRSTISNATEVADRINSLLHASGFDRFHLSVAHHDDAVGYQIVRDDNEIAIQTLSEGEKSFICFAYYWESLKGSIGANKSPEDVIAVIDDPISSLDSDTLFIVSHYIRQAASDVVSGTGNIKQLIVLTHNVQFHHEASYCSGKPNIKKRHYYRLQKSSAGITECKDDGNTSQIRNTYQMLWDAVVEAARAENESDSLRISITNIVRRIVEGYFSFLGEKGSVLNQKEMSVADQRIMMTFEIWSNAGSHTIADDIDQAIDIGNVKQFLKLFQLYFLKREQAGHFDAMIKKSGGADLLEGTGLFAQQ